jgi:N6-adenosine-specific RNA methylase IME4
LKRLKRLKRFSYPSGGKELKLTKYRTIVVDPPWQYGKWGIGSVKAQVQTTEAEPMPYDQMTVVEIAALPVAAMAAENCDLYLWTTQKYLPQAFDVLKAWGFKYCQTLTWCKAPMGTGQGGLYCPTNEFLILGRKGRMPTGKTRKDSTWWQVTRTMKHSKKPEFFQDLIEEQSDGPRVELFARRPRDGWDVWGNEVECTTELGSAV